MRSQNPVVRLASLIAVSLLLSVTAGAASYREVVVREGDTLSIIARRELGDLDRWEELAEINGLSNPDMIFPGMKIRIPSGQAVNAPEAAQAAWGNENPAASDGLVVRNTIGAIRYRTDRDAAWTDLSGEEILPLPVWIMTASNGRIESAAGGVSIRLGPSSVLTVDAVGEGPAPAEMALHLGDLSVSLPSGKEALLRTRAGRIEIEGGDFSAASGDEGELSLSVHSGEAEFFRGGEGQGVVVDAGSILTVSPDGIPSISTAPPPLSLSSPIDYAVLPDETVRFSWEDIDEAPAYDFVLDRTDGSGSLERRIDLPRIEVRRIPEGDYTWRVFPLGEDGVRGGGSLTYHLRISRVVPVLDNLLVYGLDERPVIRVSGKTNPGADVTIGTETVTAGSDGSFLAIVDAPAPGLVVVGVEAVPAEGGPPARGLAAVPAGITSRMRPEGSGYFVGEAEIPVIPFVPSGTISRTGSPGPGPLSLDPGRESPFRFTWMDEEAGVSLILDDEPPELIEVRTWPEAVAPGDTIAVRIVAADRGVGLDQAAMVEVVGPGNFHLEREAGPGLDPGEGDYIMRFRTPEDMPRGTIWVLRLEVSDRVGNSTVLSTDGLSVEAYDPNAPLRGATLGAVLLGAGIAIGSAL